MIEFEEACDLIFKNSNFLGTEQRLIENSVGYVVAQDVVSSINVAPFKNSAMDGFAVKAEWLKACSKENPRTIPIGSTSFAGSSNSSDIPDTHTLKVMTGARVPAGLDAVVPFEETKHNGDEARFFDPVSPGQHIREPGEDIAQGQKLFSKGTLLGRFDVGILASVGLRSVLTCRKPSLIIIGTGDELIDPGEELTGDRIYDSNTFTILSLVAPYCEKTERICNIPDREDDILKILDLPQDVIVTSGGVSAGERDLVVNMAESIGWKRIFHKVRIKPGKPVYVAVRGRQIMFGLPGNPLSAAVTSSVFLIPALKKISGWEDYRLNPVPATLLPGESRKTGRKLIWPGFISHEGGRTVARFSPKKSSAALTSLLGTDGLIIQNATETEPGEASVQILLWHQILKS